MAEPEMSGAGLRPLRIAVTVLVGTGVLLAALAFAVVFGPTPVDLRRALDDATSLDRVKIVDLRLPRAVAAALVGAALATAGMVFQALIRNPLASPYVLGVSAGGSLGAVLALVSGSYLIGPAAFLGALGAIALVFLVAGPTRRVGANAVLLAGVVVNAFLGACIMLVNVLSEPRNQDRILRWLVGGLRDGYDGLPLAAAAAGLLLGALAVYAHARHLNLVALGDAPAERSGVAIGRVRTALFLLASLLTAVAVSLAGPIGFVGLIVPHLVRLLLGSDHRLGLPACFFGGAAFLVVVDTLAQSLWTTPLPAGVLTAFLGGPLFLVLLRGRDRARAGLDG